MEAGEYVPDDITIRMVTEWIGAPGQKEGFILDGFPRTTAQAEALDQAVESTGGIDRVMYIKVPEDELIRRLTGRLVCRDCQTPYHLDSAPPTLEGRCDRCGGELYQRDDDKREVVERRLEVYEQQTEPVIDHYRRTGRFVEIDGVGTTEEVERALIADAA
jgi:adenylate kinase